MAKNWYLWLIPGLPAAVVRPTWHLWLLSLALSAVFHLALAATILWPELLSPQERFAVWGLFVAGWLAAALLSWSALRKEERRRERRLQADPFPLALHAYLRGDRARSEMLLRNHLRQEPQDIESALLLASVWRRQGRHQAARKLLTHLQKLEASWPWAFEIQRELEILDRNLSEAAGPDVGTAQPPRSDPSGSAVKSGAHVHGSIPLSEGVSGKPAGDSEGRSGQNVRHSSGTLSPAKAA